jgi:hypothetical protein
VRERRLLAWLSGAALLLAAPAFGGGDIVWPTYSQASHTTDVQLTCTQMHAEIDHVSADIKLLDTAKDQVEQALHSAFDLQRYAYSTTDYGGSKLSTESNRTEIYARAREDIIASKKMALERRDFLTNLLSICKEPAPAKP